MRRPLEGIRVLDLTQVWAGPKCTQVLAYLGAEVIKVEGPGRPDFMRGVRREALPGAAVSQDDRHHERQASFNSLNRRKLGITLDIRQAAGLGILQRLVAVSDVVAENFSAGVMDRLGIGYEALRKIRKDIILLSMPGFGATGPEHDYVSWAPTIEAMSGISPLIGYASGPPTHPGVALPDPLGGFFGAAAILTALHARARTGKGCFIDLSQQEALMSMNPIPFLEWQLNHRLPPRQGNRHLGAAPHGVYPCRDDDTWVAITVRGDAEWVALIDLMGHPVWAMGRFDDLPARLRARDEIDDRLAEFSRMFEASDFATRLRERGITAAEVVGLSSIAADPDMEARGVFETIDHPVVGPYPYFRPLGVHFARADLSAARAAPTFGKDNDAVLIDLIGLSQSEIDDLPGAHVIADRPLDAS